MATVVNNPGYTGESSSSNAAMIGAVLLVLAVLALLFFGRGGFGNAFNGSGGTAPRVEVPSKGQLDVNVNTNPGQ
jgi:LPXTG-motif cell wall-anchored protein